MIRGLIQRYGAALVTAGVVVCSILGSLALVIFLDLLIKRRVEAEDLIIAMIIPCALAPLMTYGFIRLSQQLDRAQEQLRVLAEQDGLTGTCNRRHGLLLAEVEWERARRHERPLSLLILDVDHFKAVNDTRGHPVGDDVLRCIAESCHACLRKTDLLARYGGDEFLILLPETEAAGGREIAERIRWKLESRFFDGGGLRLTASLGIASRSEGIATLEELIAAADAALYEAKSGGRNRVSSATLPS